MIAVLLNRKLTAEMDARFGFLAENKRMINADAKLKAIFKKDQVSMFEMTKLINNHLS